MPVYARETLLRIICTYRIETSLKYTQPAVGIYTIYIYIYVCRCVCSHTHLHDLHVKILHLLSILLMHSPCGRRIHVRRGDTCAALSIWCINLRYGVHTCSVAYTRATWHWSCGVAFTHAAKHIHVRLSVYSCSWPFIHVQLDICTCTTYSVNACGMSYTHSTRHVHVQLYMNECDVAYTRAA